jgi:hypothetical protein
MLGSLATTTCSRTSILNKRNPERDLGTGYRPRGLDLRSRVANVCGQPNSSQIASHVSKLGDRSPASNPGVIAFCVAPPSEVRQEPCRE